MATIQSIKALSDKAKGSLEKQQQLIKDLIKGKRDETSCSKVSWSDCRLSQACLMQPALCARTWSEQSVARRRCASCSKQSKTEKM